MFKIIIFLVCYLSCQFIFKFLDDHMKGPILRAIMKIFLSEYKEHAYECVGHESFDTLVIYIWVHFLRDHKNFTA